VACQQALVLINVKASFVWQGSETDRISICSTACEVDMAKSNSNPKQSDPNPSLYQMT
jgi:hypothetical protein